MNVEEHIQFIKSFRMVNRTNMAMQFVKQTETFFFVIQNEKGKTNFADCISNINQ